MHILTPKGPRHPDQMDAGDEVLSRDALTGRLICNRLETRPQLVDRSEFARWWNWKPPAFRFFRINGHFVFSRSQSIWANGFITHVALLKVGDVIFTERNGFVRVLRIEEVRRRAWYRFDVDGDHSYVLDGVLVHNASRFWVLGTDSWTAANTAPWAATSNGAGGQSVPGSSDTVTFDANSGGGTVTLNFGGTITIQSITMGAFTGTWDNSVNNNNMTLSSTGSAFNGSGSGTRTIRLGTATYTLTATSCAWNFTTVTNLTYVGSSANIVFTGSSGTRTINAGNLSHGNVSFGASSGNGFCSISGSTTYTFASLAITAPNHLVGSGGTTLTITNAFTWNGSSSAQIGLTSTAAGSALSIAAAGSSTAAWTAFRDITFTGSPTASNSFDLGGNSGITITAPSGGAAAAARVIGG